MVRRRRRVIEPVATKEMRMPESVTLELGGRTFRIEVKAVAKQASGSTWIQYGETVVLSPRSRAAGSDREGLLPPQRRVPREDLCCGAHSRRLLQAGGKADGEGDPLEPPHRPPASSALPGRLPQRDPDHVHGPLLGPAERLRHPRRDRRLGGPHGLRHPVSRAGLGRPGRGGGRNFVPNPTFPSWTSRTSTWSSRPPTRTSSWWRPERGRAGARIVEALEFAHDAILKRTHAARAARAAASQAHVPAAAA